MSSEPFTVEEYPDEAAWLSARRKSIGASEAAVILGLSHWQSPFALWASKCGVERDREETERLHWGRALESLIAQRYHEVTGYKLEDLGRFTLLRSREWPWLTATLDRRIAGDDRGPGVLEIKTVSQYVADEWLEEPPLMYQIQVQAQYAVTGYRWGELAALFGGSRFEHFPVERHNGLIESLVERARVFIDSVESRQPPAVDASDATAEALARLYPEESGRTVTLDTEAEQWHQQRAEASETKKAAEARYKEASNHLKAMIGDASIGVLPQSGIRYSCKTKKGYPVSYTVKDHRELRVMSA